jgi:hypothetical protein
MKKPEKLLIKTTLELVEGKELLKAKKRILKKAKDPLAKANAKRVLKTIEMAVESIADHRELLKAQTAPPAEAG